MGPRDRLDRRGAAYLAAFFGQSICLGFGFAFLTCGSGGVFNILRSTSSGEGIGRCLFTSTNLSYEGTHDQLALTTKFLRRHNHFQSSFPYAWLPNGI